MASFPPQWDIYPLADYANFGAVNFADTDVIVSLCLQLSPAGVADGHFRLSLSGNVMLDNILPLNSLVPLPTPHNDYRIRYQVRLPEVWPREDMLTTAWVDVETLIRRRVVDITDLGGNAVPAETVLPLFNSAGGRPTAVGASLRWAVVGNPAGRLVLQLQSLPLPTNFIQPVMHADNTVTVHIQDFDLQATYFDGDVITGIVPVLFSRDPVATRAALTANPPAALAMLQRVLGRFLLPEHISLQGATRYLRVKYRPALGSPLFSPATSPPDSKRTSTQPPVDPPPTPATAAETGKFFLTICLLFLILISVSGPFSGPRFACRGLECREI